MPRVRVGLPVALLLVLLASGTALAHPHSTPPPLSLDFIADAGSTEVHGQLIIDLALAEDWIGEAWSNPDDPADAEALGALFGALQKRCTITFNEAPVAFKPTSVVTLLAMDMAGNIDNENEKLRLNFEATLPEAPQTLHCLWSNFAGIVWEDKIEFPILIEVDRQADSALLSPEEPVFAWRRRPPEFDWSKPIRQVEVAPPPPTPTWSIPIPALVLGVLGAGALLLLLVPARRTARQGLWAAGFLVVGAALLPLPFARYEVASPFEEPPQGVLPSVAQAERIFTTLHENIYRAFANPGRDKQDEPRTEREKRIYGMLATSVTPALIDPLYVEVTESLYLRKQNGVQCFVEKIERLDGTVTFPSESWARHFHVEWHWRVHGSVTHLGHTHRRVNTYRATYLVEHDGGAWRIASIKVSEHRRLDENAESELTLETVIKGGEGDAGMPGPGGDDER